MHGPCPNVVRLMSECGPTDVRLRSEKRRLVAGGRWLVIGGWLELGRARYKCVVGGCWLVVGSRLLVVGGAGGKYFYWVIKKLLLSLQWRTVVWEGV